MAKYDLENIFSYHAPTPKQLACYTAIRKSALQFAQLVEVCVPDGQDKDKAIALIRQAVHMANAAVALEGKLYVEEEQVEKQEEEVRDVGIAPPNEVKEPESIPYPVDDTVRITHNFGNDDLFIL